MLQAALPAVRRAPAYRQLHGRLIGKPPMPAEWWVEAGLIYTVFDLLATNASDSSMALFVLLAETNELLLVRLVQPSQAQDQILIEDLFFAEENNEP